MHEAFLVRHWHWKGASKAVVPHGPLRGNSKDVFKGHCYCTHWQWGRISKDILLHTDHWRGISKENVLHWPLRGKLKGQWYTLSTEGQSQRTNTHWQLSGNFKGCCYMYTLTFDGGSQKMLLHINNKRKSRILIQILRGDLTHVFTHQHWGWVTTGKFVYSHSSCLFLSTHIFASRSEGRALNLCILCWLAPNVPTQLIIPPKVSAQNVWRTVGSKSKL